MKKFGWKFFSEEKTKTRNDIIKICRSKIRSSRWTIHAWAPPNLLAKSYYVFVVYEWIFLANLDSRKSVRHNNYIITKTNEVRKLTTSNNKKCIAAWRRDTDSWGLARLTTDWHVQNPPSVTLPLSLSLLLNSLSSLFHNRSQDDFRCLGFLIIILI